MGIKLCQDDKRSNVNPTLYKKLVESLMYLIATRLDIMFGVSLISRFMKSPKVSHWQSGKRILKYIRGTQNYGILYSRSNDFKLI